MVEELLRAMKNTLKQMTYKVNIRGGPLVETAQASDLQGKGW